MPEARVLRTPLCERLGIDVPILIGSMPEHAGMRMSAVGNPEEAARAVKAGADAVVVRGLDQISAVVDRVSPVPVVAAVEIIDGRGLAAALALGAQAVMLPENSTIDSRQIAEEAERTCIRLVEEVAERMETERRITREIAIAREVQARLFPQSIPSAKSAEFAAQCVQARSVGGDYYDFLDLGPRHLGFVLADISGKGVHAALRMANLQAHLRSQAGIAPQDPLRALRQVNRLLCESTDPGQFATLFFGIYTDDWRRLAYINCGHNPPLCLRRDGSVERLEATATVIGAFKDWECSLGRTRLGAGDLLVAYSDGITEAMRGGEEFGETRLTEVMRRHAESSPEDVVAAVLASVQEFSAGEKSDDLTILVARGR